MKISLNQETIEPDVCMEIMMLPSSLLYLFENFQNKNISKEDNEE